MQNVLPLLEYFFLEKKSTHYFEDPFLDQSFFTIPPLPPNVAESLADLFNDPLVASVRKARQRFVCEQQHVSVKKDSTIISQDIWISVPLS